MNITIEAKAKEVKAGNFRYGNIDSPYNANTCYFTKNGKSFLPIAGEYHFSRYHHADWRRELLKMKDAGITIVSTYVFWNYHEEEKDNFQFKGDNDIGYFLALCREVGLSCILRIGPWDHGEVIRGGLPKRINRMVRKRCDNPVYLAEVRSFFTALCAEVKPYMDGETVIGIQLENEYTGDTSHIRTLREMAEEIGFKTPFFTMTLWPANFPDPALLPMIGGYPEAPWSNSKKALKPNNRFAITANRAEAIIGEDLYTTKAAKADAFDEVPFASCETGPGNQVTQHRRPIISEKDGYGVGFAKFASGANWLGYYMFHGGRNPNYTTMQENKITGYPNNYPIIDYDFQAPISRWGECRPHGDLLRLMHLFINTFDNKMAEKQPFFPKWKQKDMNDITFPKCSVRMDDKGAGYFFVSTYERGLSYQDFEDVQVTVQQNGKDLCLPSIKIQAEAMFFYPFNWEIGGTLFDYVLAQPIAKTTVGDTTTCYFMECPGIAPCLSVNGGVMALSTDQVGYTFTDNHHKFKIIVLSSERAKTFHVANGKAVFAQGTLYTDRQTAICETTDGYLEVNGKRTEAAPIDLTGECTLTECAPVRLPYNYYLYSGGKRRYYSLKFSPNLLNEHYDIRLEFQFTGLNLQVFSGNQIINDYFNIDGNFVMQLKEYRRYLEKNNELTIKAVPATKFGVGNVYAEIQFPANQVDLKLLSAKAVQRIKKNMA